MNKYIKYLVLPLSLLSTHLHAGSIMLEAGIHAGGDKLATAIFVDGDTESVEGGGLFSFSAGYIADISDNMEIRTSFGIKFDVVAASNGDITFTRYPVDVMLFTKGEKFSFGIGPTYHMSPKLDIDAPTNLLNVPGVSTVNFDDAFGLVAEIDYKLGERGYLGLKFTSIDYEVNEQFLSGEANGNSVGVVIGARF